MPVILLTLAWNPYGVGGVHLAGWSFEISGRSDSIDMSAHKFVRVGTAPYERAYPTNKMVGVGPAVWVLTPAQESILGKNKGASSDTLPMVYAARYLEALEGKGFNVVASHSSVQQSSSGFSGSAQVVSHIWTLKYAPKSSTQITA